MGRKNEYTVKVFKQQSLISWCLEGAKEITEKASKSSKKSKSKSSDSKFSDFIFPDRKSSKKSKDWNPGYRFDDCKKYNCQAETIIYTFIAFEIKKIKPSTMWNSELPTIFHSRLCNKKVGNHLELSKCK